MKIAIIGYGKMGKAIESIALERGHEISLKVDSSNSGSISSKDLESSDVAIEFSRPENAVSNIKMCVEAKTPIVVGTTGWYDEYDAVSDLVKANDTALLAATNFSVGVNIFFELNKKLAAMMEPQKDYRSMITEIHHLQKLDSPSGTAITLAEGIIEKHSGYKQWENDVPQDPSTLAILSEREAEVPGTHIIEYSSDIDEISISHKAKNRKGFALGAVLAAEYIHGKSGIYQMKDVLNI